jgi:hypothetical protein
VWQTMQQAAAGTLPDPWREPPGIFARNRAEVDEPQDTADAPVI